MMQQLTFDAPQSRATDPHTSRLAQEAVAQGNSFLIGAIRWTVTAFDRPMSAFEIAKAVRQIHGDRWDEGTIVTAVSRSRLEVVDEEGVSPRGRKCRRYTLAAS